MKTESLKPQNMDTSQTPTKAPIRKPMRSFVRNQKPELRRDSGPKSPGQRFLAARIFGTEEDRTSKKKADDLEPLNPKPVTLKKTLNPYTLSPKSLNPKPKTLTSGVWGLGLRAR